MEDRGAKRKCKSEADAKMRAQSEAGHHDTGASLDAANNTCDEQASPDPFSSPPDSSPPAPPPPEQLMRAGEDDRYRMVEDELLRTAQCFTTRLHRAEYDRLRRLARTRNAAAIHAMERPVVVTSTPVAAVARRRRDRQRALAIAASNADPDPDLELPWYGDACQARIPTGFDHERRPQQRFEPQRLGACGLFPKATRSRWTRSTSVFYTGYGEDQCCCE
ncbi:hypothetical protein RJ55_06303 [Drechmeria coniospora]|nr:hypothetical protein RJ55_06303 [Drechmeria coniospora]